MFRKRIHATALPVVLVWAGLGCGTGLDAGSGDDDDDDGAFDAGASGQCFSSSECPTGWECSEFGVCVPPSTSGGVRWLAMTAYARCFAAGASPRLLTIHGLMFGSAPITMSDQSPAESPTYFPGRRNSDPCVPKWMTAFAWNSPPMT
mgnify:CR=1 FL=1